MKKTIQFILILCVALISAQCIAVKSANLQRNSAKEVAVFSTQIPNKEYIELKYLQVEGSAFSTPEKLIKTLSEKAKKEGADAVINVQYAYIVYLPYVWGIAIKYK